jgi:replicative superfamily II helicase
MQLDDLARWGIPTRFVELWRQRLGQTLLPVQSRAVRKGLLGSGGQVDEYETVRMIISAPTSSGKSFCAEMAMVRALAARRKAVMVFPLKSLAEETYRLLHDSYAPLGVKCLLVTGDYPENDLPFRGGDYHIAVAIYEKFDLLLTNSLDALKNIGLVVIDEIQTVAEPGRGPVLERALTKVLSSVYFPSLVALSAVIGDAENAAGRLAAWLGAVLVEESSRPVDLIRGVAAEGVFRFRSYNDGHDGDTPFVKVEPDEDPFDAFVRQIKADGGSTLIFLKSRQDTVDRSFRLAAAVDWPPAKTALGRLEGEEPSFLVRSLRQALGRGVAFHNSDLSSCQRRIVEQAFIDGEVRAVFSTTTLAMGVNLPADTVYLDTVKYSPGRYDQRSSLVPVTHSEFDNMTGRAGRLGQRKGAKPGRAIVLAETEFDREILWENYIGCDRTDPPRSAFESAPLADWLLNMLVSTGGKIGPSELFGHTLCAAMGGELSSAETDEALTFLDRSGLIRETDQSGFLNGPAYLPTSLGEAAAKSGLRVREAAHFLKILASDRPETPFGWTALALSSPDWVLPPGLLTRHEQAGDVSLRMLCESFDHAALEARFIIGAVHRSEPLSYRAAASLKALLLLDDWCRLTPLQRLEERYQIHLGQIMSLGETAAHLVASLAALIEAKDKQTPFGVVLRERAFSLRTGLPASLQGIYRCFHDILNRADFAALQKAGVKTPADLERMSAGELERIINADDKLKAFNEKLQSFREEIDMLTGSMTFESNRRVGGATGGALPQAVEIDGSMEGERYLVKIDGFPVRLTGKSFKYFVKLAWWRLNRDAGWIYKEDIEIGFNQARYLYRMKNEISASLKSPWPMLENNRLGYYRLNVEPGRIHFNLSNLQSHPDYELRSMVTGADRASLN